MLTKYLWIVQFISNGHPSSFEVSFEIELGLLDFNEIKNGETCMEKSSQISFSRTQNEIEI